MQLGLKAKEKQELNTSKYWRDLPKIGDKHCPQGLLRVSWEDSTQLIITILPLPLPFILVEGGKKKKESH